MIFVNVTKLIKRRSGLFELIIRSKDDDIYFPDKEKCIKIESDIKDELNSIIKENNLKLDNFNNDSVNKLNHLIKTTLNKIAKKYKNVRLSERQQIIDI